MEPVRIPVEVEGPPPSFEEARRGFDREQVETYVSTTQQELAELRWERDDLLARQREWSAERAELLEVLDTDGPLPAARRMHRILRVAEEQAEDLIVQARRECAGILEAATVEAAAVRSRADEYAAARRAEAISARASVRAASEQQREILERQLAEQRRNADLEIAGLLTKAQAQADEIRAQGARDLARIRAEARAELDVYERRREELATDLASLRDQLIWLTSRLGGDLPREVIEIPGLPPVVPGLPDQAFAERIQAPPVTP